MDNFNSPKDNDPETAWVEPFMNFMLPLIILGIMALGLYLGYWNESQWINGLGT